MTFVFWIGFGVFVFVLFAVIASVLYVQERNAEKAVRADNGPHYYRPSIGLDRHRQELRREQWSIHRFDALALYNAEKGRGIVHTDAWKAEMAEVQAKWNSMFPPVPMTYPIGEK